eukprot:TRINITY_DN395_c0_g1_i1.p1 TRINITY_DN395_c0_g1~~TRINITY_DN395_c0_g1_i1.p1  ORF type:complete len:191 (-),score=50.63 TRINITY_DN395_c0_g1_i1:54-626(-)
MGRDKYENEELIKYGWPEDVWFHVDNLSSAHVYLRLKQGQNVKQIPPEVLEDCAQLVKDNSIEGCKKDNVNVIYTLWSNLKKTGDMDVGQVGFHDEKAVYNFRVAKKINMIVNRLNKTKVERNPDLAADREQRDKEERHIRKKEVVEQKRKEKEEAEKHRQEKEMRSYSNIMKSENMRSNKDVDDDDDFM